MSTRGLFSRTVSRGSQGRTRRIQKQTFRRLLIEPLEDRRLMAVIDLATLTPSQGAVIYGADAGDQSGRSVSNVGDANGDGFDDFIIGGMFGDGAANGNLDSGESYLIFGKADWTSTPSLNLASLSSTEGITIFGVDANDYSGNSVSGAGDVNGDGYDDFAIGTPWAKGLSNSLNNVGESYLVFGKANWSATPTINLATLGTSGVTIFGVNASDYGGFVSEAGDVNGDGFDDLLIGATGADGASNNKSRAGESYLIFGKVDWISTPTINLSNLGSDGVVVFGIDADDESGYGIGGIGDLNGDGFDDFAIGATHAGGPSNSRFWSGESYVIFGKASFSPTMDLANLGQTGHASGIKVYGKAENDFTGHSLSGAGDLDGDGFDDLIIGAFGANNLESAFVGNSYVIYGGTSLPSTIDLLTLGQVGQARGNTILGSDEGDHLGRSVSRSGDLNADGYDDLIISATLADALGNAKSEAGESYVIFGGNSLPTTINPATLGQVGQPKGITIFGVDAGDRSGHMVSSAGDINGDGFGDVLISSYRAKSIGNAKDWAGENYLIFGGNGFTNSVAAANLGNGSSNSVVGTGGSESINGAAGHDTLQGKGGADVLIGGQGNDILAVSDLSFRRIVGGTGNDTLRLDRGGLLLNLISIEDNRILDIEQIDITGTGNNTLRLNQPEVFNLSSSTNTITVIGNAGDRVQLDATNWTQLASSGSFKVFVNGAATLKVSDVVTMVDSIEISMIDLSTLGPNGSTIYGAGSGDTSGFSVSKTGDMNGDGYDDLLIGALSADALGNDKINAGDSYLIFGGASISETIDLANIGSAGITIFGGDTDDRSGRSVSDAGDVNGDGFNDLLIGASGGDAFQNSKSSAGESYLIFGKANWTTTPTIDLASLGSAGITLFGSEVEDYSGFSLSGAGDVNGDGFEDLVIGAASADASGNAKPGAGESYVIFGAASLPATIDLANLGSAGVTIFGADAGDGSGRSVSGAGDVNGDGFDDVLIGALSADGVGNLKPEVGESYVIFGASSLPSTIDLAVLGTAGFVMVGSDESDRSGELVSNAGDINGDGFDDLLVGVASGDGSANSKPESGETYLIFGKSDWSSTPTIDFANIASVGITFFGADASDSSGFGISGAGDVNGDGFDDLLLGAPQGDGSQNSRSVSGETYVIFGRSDWSSTPTIDLANLGSSGIPIFGADNYDLSGRSVSSAQDINGDGFDDLIIGAFQADASGNSKQAAGESYVIFGSNDFTNSIAVVNLGNANANTINGTATANILNGANGNDTLVGNGGADVLIGGRGNDVLAVSDLTFQRIGGGTGIDTLRLDGSGLSMNLSNIADNRILDIEQIDISGTGNNTLTLNQREVLNLSSLKNTLVVLRNAGDVINIGTGWTQIANETIGTIPFNAYTQGQAILKVQVVGVASIANRRVFYNRSTSSVFGNGSGNPINAIDSTKTALLPGQTTSFANYTNYNRGMNGIVVDVANVGGLITAADFQFATWDGINVAGFTSTSAVASVSIIPNGGLSNSTRVKIEFADNAIQNTWLRITMLANLNTGFTSNNVFYFGNAIGDMSVGNVGSPVTVRTNATDTSIVRQNQSIGANSVGVTSIHDLNKDGRVNATDTSIIRQNQLASIVRFFNAPASFLAADAELAVDSIMADSSWLDGLEPFSTKRRAERMLR